MVNKSRRRTKTCRISYRKTFPMKLRRNNGKIHRGGRKTRGRKTRRRKTPEKTSPNKFITSDRIVTKLSEVAKHPIHYITKPTIPFHLDKKTLDPIDGAQMSSIVAHIGLDASEM